MSMPDLETRLSPCLRVTRIIVVALALGIIVFAVIAVVQREQNPAPPPPPHLITYLAVGFGALQIVLQAIVPGLLVNGLRRQLARGTWPRPQPGVMIPPDDAGKLCMLFQTRSILGAAFAEGAAFFLLIAYLLEGQLLALGGAVVMLALILARFPTRPGLESWLAEQLDRLSQERLAL